MNQITKDEALKLALEALEGVVKNCWRDIPSWRLDEIKEQIAAIKQALEAPVQVSIEMAPDPAATLHPELYKATWEAMHGPAPVQERTVFKHYPEYTDFSPIFGGITKGQP
jgi:hypothetical protein